MSLYDMAVGSNPEGESLVGMIAEHSGLDNPRDFIVGRYRDAWIERHGDEVLIRVHTRNGGGNREDYAEAIECMRVHPWFVRDADDEFDDTYADFYFRPDLTKLPADLARVLPLMAVPPVNNRERWQQAIDSIARRGKLD